MKHLLIGLVLFGLTIVYHADRGFGWIYVNQSGYDMTVICSNGSAQVFGSDGVHYRISEDQFLTQYFKNNPNVHTAEDALKGAKAFITEAGGR